MWIGYWVPEVGDGVWRQEEIASGVGGGVKGTQQGEGVGRVTLTPASHLEWHQSLCFEQNRDKQKLFEKAF